MTPHNNMSLIVSYTMEQKRKNCHIHGEQTFALVKVKEVNVLGSPLGWSWLSLGWHMQPVMVGRQFVDEHFLVSNAVREVSAILSVYLLTLWKQGEATLAVIPLDGKETSGQDKSLLITFVFTSVSLTWEYVSIAFQMWQPACKKWGLKTAHLWWTIGSPCCGTCLWRGSPQPYACC